MLIAQLSDLHISKGRAKLYGLVDTSTMLEQAVAHLIALTPRPNAVVVTGDLVESGSAADYSLLRELLEPIFQRKQSMRCYLLAGNHDDRNALRREFGDCAYLGQSDEFIQYFALLGPLKLIALDTTVPGSSQGDLCSKRLKWFEHELETDERPTIVAMHHPPFVTGIAAMDVSGLIAKYEFERIVSDHPKIERIICGHFHRPIQARVGYCLASVAPSVAHQTKLEFDVTKPASFVPEPPGYQLHWWNGKQLVTHTVAVGDYGLGHLY